MDSLDLCILLAKFKFQDSNLLVLRLNLVLRIGRSLLDHFRLSSFDLLQVGQVHSDIATGTDCSVQTMIVNAVKMKFVSTVLNSDPATLPLLLLRIATQTTTLRIHLQNRIGIRIDMVNKR